MDSEFLALSLVFIILGLSGIILFNGTVPPSGAPCNCIIPTPEPTAAQGTSSIFLVLGLIFFPMGLMKGGLPSLRRTIAASPTLEHPAGGIVAPVSVLSLNLFVVGVVLLLIGVDALLVPAYVLYKSLWLGLLGLLLAAGGGLAMARGLRKKPERQ